MNYDSENIFAKILRGEIPCDKVFENEHALAFPDINPQAAAHILVIPKGAYVNMDDFTANASPAEITGFFQAIGQVAREAGLSESAGGNGYRVLCNSGPDARQEVPHLHIHIAGGELLGPMLYKKRPSPA